MRYSRKKKKTFFLIFYFLTAQRSPLLTMGTKIEIFNRHASEVLKENNLVEYTELVADFLDAIHFAVKNETLNSGI